MKIAGFKSKENISDIKDSYPRMQYNRLTLSFKDPLEKLFQDDYYRSSILFFRISFFAGFLYYAGFVVLDYIVMPEAAYELSLIRFFVACPTLLVVFLLSFTPMFRKTWQFFAFGSAIITGGAIVVMTIISPELGRNSYYTGIILVLIYSYLLIRLRFFIACSAGWLLVIAYLLSYIFFPDVDKKVFTTNMFFLTSANILGMFGAYMLEFLTRREFYYRHLLKEEHLKVEAANAELEVKVSEKTAELQRDLALIKETEAELIKAKEKAEESDRLKSAFLANMSHEIRTPMNGILGFSELLGHADLSHDKKSEYISIIQKSGYRMLDTINDLINISKIEAGLVDVSLLNENLNLIAEELYNFFLPEAKEKGLDLLFEKKLPEEYCIVLSDREKLISILTNLIKNAIKYTLKGQVTFGYNFYESGQEIEFYIRDTGIGIPEDRIKLIFDRFVQVDFDKNRSFEGSGLGLSITRSYAELLGGSIRVESEYGIGSLFCFNFPYKTETSQKEDVRNILKSNTSLLKWLKETTILIAEDEETSHLFLTTILNKKCHNIIHADNGKKAVELMKEHPETGLILMDIRMPELNGYEASQKIREFNKDVLIIAQTAFAMKDDREKALRAGCNEHISKPINESLLLAKINKIIPGT